MRRYLTLGTSLSTAVLTKSTVSDRICEAPAMTRILTMSVLENRLSQLNRQWKNPDRRIQASKRLLLLTSKGSLDQR